MLRWRSGGNCGGGDGVNGMVIVFDVDGTTVKLKLGAQPPSSWREVRKGSITNTESFFRERYLLANRISLASLRVY